MIRGGDTGNEVLIALISPFPPRAHPQVVLRAASAGPPLEARVLPPGALILLPAEDTVLANGRWRALSELAAQVMDEGNAIRRVVPLKGLAAGCRSRPQIARPIRTPNTR